MIRMPRVWVLNPLNRSYNSQWKFLPTPSCPDLDFATLYFDQTRQVRENGLLGIMSYSKPRVTDRCVFNEHTRLGRGCV